MALACATPRQSARRPRRDDHVRRHCLGRDLRFAFSRSILSITASRDTFTSRTPPMPDLARSIRRWLVVLAATPLASLGAQQPIDWNKLRDETAEILAGYLRINTTNPPGGELQTALYLKRILDREGIEAQILDTAELKPAGRANLYARLKGNGSKTAIALVHHMDLVPADARY